MPTQHTPKERFKTSVGGQALMEGIMMRGPEKICVAVRKPDGEIDLSYDTVRHHAWARIPFVRGVLAMVENMVLGYRYLMHSAELSMTEEEQEAEKSRFDAWLEAHAGEKLQSVIMALAALAGGGLAILLFLVLPTLLTGLLAKVLPVDGFRALLEGVFKMIIFLSYMYLCSRMKEIHRLFQYHGAEHKTIACYEAIHRLFQYHGAEHKTIACYEAGLPLTVENIRPCRRFHPRCGTSFIFLVILISILVSSVLPWPSTALRVVYKLLLLPVVMGISYELIKLAGRHDNLFTRIISAPGLWLQRLTTFEPDDSMIEVAIAAVTPVLPDKPEDGLW